MPAPLQADNLLARAHGGGDVGQVVHKTVQVLVMGPERQNDIVEAVCAKGVVVVLVGIEEGCVAREEPWHNGAQHVADMSSITNIPQALART